jgi:hypothetical protein
MQLPHCIAKVAICCSPSCSNLSDLSLSGIQFLQVDLQRAEMSANAQVSHQVPIPDLAEATGFCMSNQPDLESPLSSLGHCLLF